MAPKSSSAPEPLRLLLDQGFPNPPGFRPDSVDRSLTVEHLSHWRRDLSEQRTPDWVLYCEAALAGFHGLVTRDFSQAQQPEEMFVLDRLRNFHVVSWGNRMDDPIAEWGQLLAYLPALRRYLHGPTSTVIFLPTPQLTTNRNVHAPKRYLGEIAKATGIAVAQVRRDATQQVRDWEAEFTAEPGRFTDLLRLGR